MRRAKIAGQALVVGITALITIGVVACDDKKGSGGASGSASVNPAAALSSALAAIQASASASASVAAAASSSSAAPAGSGAGSLITGDAKDVVLTMKDPSKEPEKSIKAQVGGSVTVFLPDHPGTVWSVDSSDKTLGKAKEEVIPGFAPGTNGHQFKWSTSGPLFKAGVKHNAKFVNKKAGDKTAKPTATFTLTIEMT